MVHTNEGREMDLWTISMAVFTALHVQVHVKLFLATASWTWVVVVADLLSLFSWFLVWPAYTQIYSISWGMASQTWYSFGNNFADIRFYLAVLISVSVCMVFDVAAKFVWKNYKSYYRHPQKVQETNPLTEVTVIRRRFRTHSRG
jgi:hypothetical protein